MRMKHYRVVIMDKVIEILTRRATSTGRWNTVAEDRVYRQKYSPLSDDPEVNAKYLPAIVLYTNEEDTSAVDDTLERCVIDLAVECYALVPSTADDPPRFDDDLDVMLEQIRIALYRDQYLEGVVEWIRRKKTEWFFDKGSEAIVEGARLTFEVKYVVENTSTLPLDDFDEADVSMTVGDNSLASTIGLS